MSLRNQIAVYAGLLALAVLVGVATHPATTAAGERLASEPVIAVLQSLVWLGLAADVAVVGLFVYALFPGRVTRKAAEPAPAAGRDLHWAVKLGALVAALLPLVVGFAVLLHNRTQRSPGILPGAYGAPVHGSASATQSVESGGLAWLTLGIAASIVVALALWWWLVSRRRPAKHEGRAAVLAQVSDVLDDSLERLRSEADPRRAVIAAYTSMEAALGRIGLPRHHFEAPLEFVARILASLPVAAADARELTDLFELAKFSQHAIDEGMRSSAIAAVSAIRDNLRPGVAA